MAFLVFSWWYFPPNIIKIQTNFDSIPGANKVELLKEARNSFVGRAQTGFQFTRETQKFKNEQAKMASRSRLDFIFCAGQLRLGKVENDWNLGDTSLESCPFQCYQGDRQLSRI